MRKGFRLVVLLCCFILLFNSCFWDKKRASDKITKEKNKFEEIIRGTSVKKIPKEAEGRKNTLIVGVNELRGVFNPIYSTGIYDNWAVSLIFDGLVSHDEKGNIVGNIAKEWNISDDGKEYTFILKDNVRFSDGSEVTAEDVAFTYTALCDPAYIGPYGHKLNKLVGYNAYITGSASKVTGINIDGKYQVSFTFTEANSSLIYDFETGILPKKYYNFAKGNIKTMENLAAKPMGCGEYQLEFFDEGKQLVLVRNENYFKGKVTIPNLVLKVTPGNESIKQLSNGQIDISRISTSAENVKYFEALGFTEMHLYDDNGYQYIGLNLRLDKFKDKRVRQALMYGLNREKFVKDYYGEYGSSYNAPFAVCSWAYPTGLSSYQYNVDKANKLLDEAGWAKKEDGYRYNSSGEKMSIKWSTYEGSKYVEKLIGAVEGNWKQLGVALEIERMPFKNLVEKVYDKRDFEMYNMYWILTPDPDPSPIFSIKEDVPGGYNSVGWRNEESENLLQGALKENNAEKRKELYNQWGRLANEELPYLFLNQNKEMMVSNIRVEGLKLSPYKEWTFDSMSLKINNYSGKKQ